MSEEPFPLGAIPERLKCAICTALARDAWKLSCCDQVICGPCFETLPVDACPICAFSPVDKEKCTAATSLRTTIAVFLRHAEKRYKDALAKEAKEGDARSGLLGQGSSLHSDGSTARPTETVMSNNDDRIQDHAEIDPAQSHALVQGSEDEIARQQTPSMNTMAIQQQQREYEKMYGGPDPGLNGMNMGFNPMTNGYPMGSMNPMMMHQMAMAGGFGGFGGGGMNWNSNMMQGYPQNMNIQAQESNFPDQALPAGPSMSDYSSRGGFRGRYAPRGHMSSFRGGRGGYQPSPTSVAPVFVEGAPTGPSAMRNGGDSRGRGGRGRGGFTRGVPPRAGFDREVSQRHGDSFDGSASVPDQFSESNRGRSVTRSLSRERSTPAPRQSSPIGREPSPAGRSSRPAQRSVSPLHRDKSREARKLHRDRSTSRETRRHRDRPEAIEEDLATQSAPKSLADRIEKIPRSRTRSRSPRSDKHKSRRRSSHRTRRRRSTSRNRSDRNRSRSDERRQRSRRDHSSERESSRKHKKNHNVFEDPETSDRKSSRRRRSRERERDSHRRPSRRSDAKFEIGSPELRRLEDQREKARYD